MKIINQNLVYPNSSLSRRKEPSINYPATTPIVSTSLNNLNFANKSLITFCSRGYYKTLEQNYFNLPADETTGQPYKPDIYQKAAAENLYKGNDVIVTAPTGTGKTAIAHYIINKNLDEGVKTFYTTPLKALSNDKLREFRKIYGEDNVGLITGDKKINKDAPIILMTTEVYRNMVVNDSLKEENPILDNLKTVIFDELHYLGDTDRGGVWEQSIMFTKPDVQMLSLSGTMANPERITDWMSKIKGYSNPEKVTPKQGYRANDKGIHTVLINVPPENRNVPLEYIIEPVDAQKTNLSGKFSGTKAERIKAQRKARQIAFSDSAVPAKHSYSEMVDVLKENDRLPAIFFVFSKKESKAILRHFSDYGDKLTTDKETKQIEKTIDDFKSSGKYLGESLNINALKKGYAIHNAGMLPEQKELIEELFQKKLLKVVISTETLSAGINMPARTTVITALRKPTDTPDGDDHKRYITPNEFHQMAGRAGRRGIDTKGYCYVMCVNKSQKRKYEELINTPFNDIASHLNLDYSFVATAGNAYRDKSGLKQIFERSLFAYDENPEITKQKAANMATEFLRKEDVLKDYRYIDKKNQLSLKGKLLSCLNGYEQIPVMESITSKELAGLNPVQLAGYVGGLANMETMPKNEIPYKEDAVDLQDGFVEDMVDNLASGIKEYNHYVYAPLGRRLKTNNNAIAHVYEWAKLNSENENSTENWKNVYSGDMKKSIRDEGSLFREIMMTSDLLKQMDDISNTALNLTTNNDDIEYYSKLSDTINESLRLINREPTLGFENKI